MTTASKGPNKRVKPLVVCAMCGMEGGHKSHCPVLDLPSHADVANHVKSLFANSAMQCEYCLKPFTEGPCECDPAIGKVGLTWPTAKTKFVKADFVQATDSDCQIVIRVHGHLVDPQQICTIAENLAYQIDHAIALSGMIGGGVYKNVTGFEVEFQHIHSAHMRKKG